MGLHCNKSSPITPFLKNTQTHETKEVQVYKDKVSPEVDQNDIFVALTGGDSQLSYLSKGEGWFTITVKNNTLLLLRLKI